MSTNKNHEHHSSEEGFVSKSEKFLERNFSKIGISILIIVAIVVGYFAYRYLIVNPSNEKAQEALFKAEQSFMERNDSLALNGKSGAQAGLLEILKNYSNTDAANLASAYAGICYYDAGKYQEALNNLKKFSSDDNMVGPSIERLKGDCYVQLGQLDMAAKTFMSAAKKADNPVISPTCLFKAGHVYEELGDMDKAKDAYQMIKDKYYENAQATSQVENDLVRVETKMKK